MSTEQMSTEQMSTQPYAAWGKLKPLTSFTSTAAKERPLVPDKHFTFAPVIKSGDCQLNHAEVFLVSDGRFYFQAAVQSRASSGDVWEIFWMLLLDKDGRTLFQIPQFNGPQMDEPNQQYRWEYETWYPMHLYPDVASLRMDSHC